MYSPVSSIAAAILSSIGGRMWGSPLVSSVASSVATVSARRHIRATISSSATALGFIHVDVNRQIPWDEAAPEERQFIVPAEPHTFLVVN